jgi:hypothetical protein
MQKVLSIIIKYLSVVIQLALVVGVSAFILFISFIIDPKFSENFSGNDVPSAYTYTVWINQTFPNIFFWYQYQGAGVSFTSGYQWLAHISAVIIHKVAEIPLSAAFATLRAAAFPISAIGIILFCWTRLEYPKQGYTRILIGSIAALFFLLSPITWYWTHKWGFYAEGVSYMFIAPALLFADWYIDLEFKKSKSWKKRLSLILAGGFWSLGFLTHFYTGSGIAHFIVIMLFSATIWNIFKNKENLPVEVKTIVNEDEDDPTKKSKFKISLNIKESLIIGVKAGLSILAVFLLFSFWRLSSYIDYTKQVALGGFAGDLFSSQNAESLNKPSLGQITQLEFIAFPDQRFIFDGYSVPLTIWIFAAISLALSWTRSRKVWTISLAVLYGFFSYSVTSVINATYLFGPFAQVFNFRSVWTVYRIILPIAAAYGIFLIPDLISWLPDFLLRKISKYTGFVSSHLLKPLFIFPAMLVILFFVTKSIELDKKIFGIELKNYNSTINYLQKPNIYILTAGRRNIDSRNIWQQHDENYTLLKDNTELQVRVNIPEMKQYCKENKDLISPVNDFCKTTELGANADPQSLSSMGDYCNKLPRSKQIDANSWCQNFDRPLADQLKIENWPEITFKETHQVTEAEIKEFEHLPNNPLETRYDLSGLSGSILMRSPLINPISITQVYINQLTLFSALWNYQSSVMYADQPNYQKAGILTEFAQYFGYEYVNAAVNTPRAAQLYADDPNWQKIGKGDWQHFQKPTGLLTWNNHPRVLFISDSSKFTYDQFFKLANVGVLPYQNGIIYNGSKNLDDYKLTELQNFNLIILAGYKYKNAKSAHELVDQYIKNGGNVFIDTGWQYQNDDWQIKSNVPEFFPTNKIEWKETNINSTLEIDDASKIDYQVNKKDLGKISILDQKWNVSSASDVRSDASVILYTDGNPVMIARNYQKGKIVWSGLNIIPHIEGGNNQNEGEIKVFAKALSWLLPSCQNCNTDTYPYKIERPNPDNIYFTLDQTTSEATTFYWRESFHPKWKASLINNNKNQNLQIYRAGPRMMGIVVPPVQSGAQITLKIQNSFFEDLVNFLTIFGILCVPLFILNVHAPLLRLHRSKL